ncbi:ArnT family glycosyltransferase [Hymenobacter weizhouensis]|uniref:ArnT family glycosyltransferase n=1 Tax=Hymenobacter sp. YIM 151500-1 TaxID=2987689 RepID=UPI0022260D70|nr:glycosyltransferase family 39 protein [Hymenobacter sp. YIM 151500-1]UYZ64370.1 glycosyltransferase family 39 protein [Hymenobacter sp. YIM 151500-1]
MNRTGPGLATWALLFVAAFTVAYFFLTHEGLYALDDYFYARYAHQLLSGTFRVEPDPLGLLHDPLKERFLIFGPVAGLYALLGVNIISTTLWPLLATLGCAVLMWRLYGRREPVVAAGAMLLLGLHYFTLNLTNYLYPDNILMFWCLACAAALLSGRRPGRQQPGRWGLLFAGLNFAALLSKETIIYYLPFYVGVLVLDLRRRRHGRFWAVAVGSGAALLVIYLGFYQVFTDDALYRLHLIERTNEFLKEGNYLLGNRAALVARLTWQPLAFFVSIGLAPMLVLAAVAARRPGPVLASEAPETGPDRQFWLALAGSTLAFYWLGSTSFSQYNPITLLPRMTTPLLPPLALAAGFGLRHVLLEGTGRAAAGVGALLLGAAAWLHNSLSVVYGALGLYWLAVGLGQGRRFWPAALRPGTGALVALTLLVLAGSLALRPVYFMQKPSVSSHFAQERVIRGHLTAPAAQGVVFVDDYLIGNYDFYYSFRVPPGLRYRRFWARDSVQLAPGERAWLLLNRSTLTNDELTRKLIRYSPDSVLSWYPRRRLVEQYGKVELYEVKW